MREPSKCHVVLVAGDDDKKTWQDFQQIAAVARSCGVQAHVVGHRASSQLKVLPLWLKRSVSIAPAGVRDRQLLPGRFLSGRFMSKIEEYAILEAAGVPVPKWVEITPSTILDPDEWGPYVVEKPSLGRKGALVRIRKTSRVRYAPPVELRSGQQGGAMIAQRFIYTGERPISYRVVTFFGEVLSCFREATLDHGPPLPSRWAFRELGGISIVSNTKTMEVKLVEDEAIMDLAKRSHMAAFPDIPLLQFDIIRDADTGEHFVIESHPRHRWWPFSHRVILKWQKELGFDFEGQFGALKRAGRIVAEKAKELATRFPC